MAVRQAILPHERISNNIVNTFYNSWSQPSLSNKCNTYLVSINKFLYLLNSLPLTYMSGDPNYMPLLKPNHLLIGEMCGELALESVDTRLVQKTL